MIDIITQLRHHLHNCAEISGKEEKTKALLMNFLKKYTTLELHPCGEGFYAAHREKNAVKPAIALRADYDALAMPDGTAKHLCGHDGHAAALCGAAIMAEGKTFERSIFFLFQPAEETGAGAAPCCELFQKEDVDEIYGAHNLPGAPLGQVTTRPGTRRIARAAFEYAKNISKDFCYNIIMTVILSPLYEFMCEQFTFVFFFLKLCKYFRNYIFEVLVVVVKLTCLRIVKHSAKILYKIRAEDVCKQHLKRVFTSAADLKHQR